MQQMTDQVWETLVALALAAGSPVVRARDLSRRVGCLMAELGAPLGELSRLGLAKPWIDPVGGSLVVLEPGPAAAAGVPGLPPEGREPRRRRDALTVAETDLPEHGDRNPRVHNPRSLRDLTDDRAPDPVAAAEEAEHWESVRRNCQAPSARRNPSAVAGPYPRVLHGERLQWPVESQRHETGHLCEGCHGRAFGSIDYCLVCDRWGHGERRGRPRKRRGPPPDRSQTTAPRSHPPAPHQSSGKPESDGQPAGLQVQTSGLAELCDSP